MGYHPRIETPKTASFQTTRARNSELWFVNNNKLDQAILGYVAKYQQRYDILLYAFAIEGNHIQFPARFPKANRSDYMRDLNASVARAVPRFTVQFSKGSFWERRFSSELLPGCDDIEEYFFYTVLQAVQDGLVEKISDYPGYNCFHDAVWGIKRIFKVVNWTEYNEAKRHRPDVKICDYITYHELCYQRLPGYEHLSQKEYALLMHEKLEARRQKIVQYRKAHGLGFAGREALLKTKPGSIPKETKTSNRYSHRPRVLCICARRRDEWLEWYFEIYDLYKDASRSYRAGNLSTEFPEGTYRPPFRAPPTAAA